MKIRTLHTEITTERGADTQAVAGKAIFSGSGDGANTARYAKIETEFAAAGGKYHPTLSELRRYLASKGKRISRELVGG